MAGKRSSRMRRGLGRRVERGGQAALAETWSLAVWLVISVGALIAGPWAWLRRRHRGGQLLLIAGGITAAIVAVPKIYECGPDAPSTPTEAEALARVIRSEIGTGNPQQKLHVGWATRNLAAERGQSIAEMACAPCGPQEAGRPVSSRQPATDGDRELAQLIIEADPRLDPTGGATHFVNPRLQDELARRGAPGYEGRPYHRVRRVWTRSYGWEPYYRLGGELELWGPARK